MEKRNRTEKRLTVKQIEALGPGWHDDGGGLRLRVETSGSRTWMQRLTINGRRVNRGLGGYPLITLEMAGDRSIDLRRAARDGQDLARRGGVTFAQVFEQHFAQRQKGLTNEKHIWQWRHGI